MGRLCIYECFALHWARSVAVVREQDEARAASLIGCARGTRRGGGESARRPPLATHTPCEHSRPVWLARAALTDPHRPLSSPFAPRRARRSALGISLANHLKASRGLYKALKPLADRYANLAGFRAYGLKYDDVLIEESASVQKVRPSSLISLPVHLARRSRGACEPGASSKGCFGHALGTAQPHERSPSTAIFHLDKLLSPTSPLV